MRRSRGLGDVYKRQPLIVTLDQRDELSTSGLKVPVVPASDWLDRDAS
jgi:hypothetical protein